MTGTYLPRHRANAGFGDVSLPARLAHDRRQAQRAVRVLAANDHLPAARTLYRELHRAGVLMPHGDHCRTVLAADLIARELAGVAA